MQTLAVTFVLTLNGTQAGKSEEENGGCQLVIMLPYEKLFEWKAL